LPYQSIPLKTVRYHTILFAFLLFSKFSSAQGRVVINEFMPWSGCSTTSEFIELLNFGPGPMNIGCYIVTNGTYSVTIPPNTILQRGQYFVLSGQDILSKNCGNPDSAVHVDLNWTTCNCTNVPIPTTGDGFMQNGGNANEKMVLLDPNLNVVDAIARNTPVSSSVPITTPALSGGCSSKNFDLSTMTIGYETINSSTGIDNSFARKVDGDCGWVKTTDISARAPNKTGSTASATYDFNTVSTTQCNNTDGAISIQVNSSNVSALFPMNYTLGFDADANGVFDGSDQYTYGVDSSASSIDITHLAYGRYRITVASSSSCNLKSFDFYVFNCYTVILPVRLLNFTYGGIKNGQHIFQFKIDQASTLSNVVLEAGDGGSFAPVAVLYGPVHADENAIAADVSSYHYYRLRLTSQTGAVSYSKEIKLPSLGGAAICWPNPVKDKVFIKIKTIGRGRLSYSITNANGAVVKTSGIETSAGEQVLSIPVTDMNSGMYYLKITGSSLREPVFVRFIK
jgi:hypothetical protein